MCAMQILASMKEKKALSSWSRFKQANPHPQNMIWIRPFQTTRNAWYISGHQVTSVACYMCYIIQFPQTVQI